MVFYSVGLMALERTELRLANMISPFASVVPRFGQTAFIAGLIYTHAKTRTQHGPILPVSEKSSLSLDPEEKPAAP